MTFAEKVINFHKEINPNWKLPSGIELIYPFSQEETWKVFGQFYNKYFNDENRRTFLFGINPGRLGAGVTGVPFTDPKILENVIGIPNTFHKRNELSALFVYDMIENMGGPKAFYSKYYITSVCPLGFISKGKNVNYYDDAKLQAKVEPYIIDNINTQKLIGANEDVAFSMGQGKNFKYLKKLNDQHGFFKEIQPLPHPRWVMQYRLKRKQEYIDEYTVKLSAAG